MASRRKAGRGENDQAAYLKEKINDTEKLVEALKIGIADITTPDFGEPIPLETGEIPVFWACGVTPQMAIKQARPDICITHAPGFMVISDIAASELAAGRGPEISSAP